MKKSILFIINPISGVKKSKNFDAQIQRLLDGQKFDYSIEYTQYKGHAVELTKTAVKNNVDIVVAAGGDGTINEIASNLINSNTALAIIPAGSGNGLARHLQIPVSLKKALKIINKLNISEIDACSINDRYFFSIAGVGYDAKVAYDFNFGKKRGFVNYVRPVIRNYFAYDSDFYDIEYDGLKIEKKAFFVTFANSSQWGYNVKIAPKASLQDGILEICVCKKPNFFILFFTAILLLLNLIDKSRMVEFLHCKNVIVKSQNNKKEIYLHIDGEAIGVVPEVNISVLKDALRVLTP